MHPASGKASPRGTRKPLPFSGWATCSRRKARVITAVDTKGISRSRAAASGAKGASHRAASKAGTASTTPSASSVSPSAIAAR